jgi:carbon storage regulator
MLTGRVFSTLRPDAAQNGKGFQMALVLSRRVNETVVIGGTIRATIKEVRGNKVWLAFEAPTDVSIHREEIQQLLDTKAANPRKRRE